MRIDAAGTPWGLAFAAGLLVLAVAFAWIGPFTDLYPVGFCLTSAVVIVSTVIAHRFDAVLSTPDGLLVTTRRSQILHRWTDMLEVAWLGPELPYRRPGLAVRPAAGGPWDIPGPNNPTQVATLAVFGREATRHAKTLLGQECDRHGVPFAANGTRMLMDAPPGSPYRRQK